MRITLGLTRVLFVLLAILVVSPSASAGAGAKTIDTAELHRMVMDNAYALEAGRALPYAIVDAREKKEYDEAHVFSAVSMTTPISFLPKDKAAPIAVYCGDETDACAKWAGTAIAAGYTNVAVYPEGFRAWKEKRMPVAP